MDTTRQERPGRIETWRGGDMLHYHWEHCRECDGIQLIDQRGKRAPGNPSNLPSSDRNALCSCPAAEGGGRSDVTEVDDGTLRVWFQRADPGPIAGESVNSSRAD